MDEALRKIQTQVRGFDRRRPGFRYPAAFRRLVAEYARRRVSDVSRHRLALEVGIPWATIDRWMESLRVSSPESRLLPVRVVPSPANEATRLVLISPDGWRIEGASPAQICAILGGLR
jgi:hypothetical protein